MCTARNRCEHGARQGAGWGGRREQLATRPAPDEDPEGAGPRTPGHRLCSSLCGSRGDVWPGRGASHRAPCYQPRGSLPVGSNPASHTSLPRAHGQVTSSLGARSALLQPPGAAVKVDDLAQSGPSVRAGYLREGARGRPTINEFAEDRSSRVPGDTASGRGQRRNCWHDPMRPRVQEAEDDQVQPPNADDYRTRFTLMSPNVISFDLECPLTQRFPSFTNEETRAWKGRVASPRSHNPHVGWTRFTGNKK